MSMPKCIFRLIAVFAVGLFLVSAARAQQTTGGITGVVTDAQGGTLAGAVVEAVGQETGLKRTQKSGDNGYYAFANLPIGHYNITVTHDGFQTQKLPDIAVQADRTATLNLTLQVGAVSTSVTVSASPLMNAVDTTNGYVLDKAQIASIPLPTGSPLGTAILSPGVSAELTQGTGALAGLGNPPIWANGQRDTSNSFSLNGVDASNLFNGKSTSSVGSARVINSTGVSTSQGGAGVIQSTASVYLSIGNAIPTPAPETIEEVRVNASMYDAQQGSTSGAHIDMSTSTGTNALHGTAYFHRGTNWINAAPFFFKQSADVPAPLKNPELHRYVLGGTVGGPIIKDKLFGYVSYQHLHVSDQEIGDSFLNVPVGLSDTNRTPSGLADGPLTTSFGGAGVTASQIDQGVLQLFNSPSLAGEPGKWLIPNDTSSATLGGAQQFDAFLPGTGRFKADMLVADVDYNATAKDTLALKYYYQHDPTLAPYAFSSVPGFTQHLDSGAQVASITNTFLVKSNLSTTQTLGFIREKTWSDNEQPFGPSAIPGGKYGTGSINEFGSKYFPGVSIYNVLGDTAYEAGVSTGILNIGPNAEGQSSNTGAFQNRWQPSGDAVWTLGRHTVSFGASYSYTQLNTIDKRTNAGTVATDDFSAFAQGLVTPGNSSTGFYVSSFLQGNANRYYRANQVGTYVQDKFQVTPTLSLTAGLRYDWDGGLTREVWPPIQLRSQFVQLQHVVGHHSESGVDYRGQQYERDIRRQQHYAYGTAMGHCSAAGRGVAAGDVPQQGGGADGLRHVLRPRRVVQLLLAGVCDWHGDWRAFRREPAASVCECDELPIGDTVLLRRLHSNLRRQQHRRQPGESLRHGAFACACKSQGFGPEQLSAECLQHCEPGLRGRTGTLPDDGADSERRRSSTMASRFRWACTIARTNCRTPITTRWMCNGSRATILPSTSVMWAISGVTR